MEDILNVKMLDNDAEAETVGDYLKALLKKLWLEGVGFSGKRPFGNSGWKYEIYSALFAAGLIERLKYEDGDGYYYEDFDIKAANKIILEAIEAL